MSIFDMMGKKSSTGIFSIELFRCKWMMVSLILIGWQGNQNKKVNQCLKKKGFRMNVLMDEFSAHIRFRPHYKQCIQINSQNLSREGKEKQYAMKKYDVIVISRGSQFHCLCFLYFNTSHSTDYVIISLFTESGVRAGNAFTFARCQRAWR